MYGVG